MKIAMMVRSFLETPVPNDVAYSPASVAQPIAEGLAARGHEITFFGPEGTGLNSGVKTETCGLRPLAKTAAELEDLVSSVDMFTNYAISLHDLKMAREMLTRADQGEFDCVIFNHFESALPLAKLFPKVPILYILHDEMDEARRRVIEMHSSPNQHFISISDSQRRDAPDLNYSATIYNGIDIESYVLEEEAEDYLIIAGRITPAKGVKEAVQVAIHAKKRLLIAGSLLKSDYWYFDEHIKPYLNDKILFLGMLDKEQLIKYYKKASALLTPIQWQEPFGLSMAEAMACGTPVIAFNRGSVPEVVADGKTGYIVDNSAEMIMAIEKLSKIRRRDCHDHVKANFTYDIMVKNYEKTIADIIGKPPEKRSGKRTKARSNFSKELSRLSRRLIRDNTSTRGSSN